MDEEKIIQTVNEEIAGLKEGLKAFVKTEDIEKEVGKITKQVEELGIPELKAQLSELNEIAEKQGLVINKMAKEQSEGKKKSLRDQIAEKSEEMAAMASDKHKSVSLKTVTASNFTDDTMSYREPGVNQIQRGMPYIRDLFNVVTLGGNTHGAISWYEQEAITNNASNVAEGAASTTQSAISWVEKTQGSKRVHDFIKVSRNQLKDVDFVAGEVNTLLNKNMRLKENAQLLSGTGTGNEIKGITNYAQSFTTTGISIQDPNLNDLIGKIKTQIRVDSLDKFLPNAYTMNPADVDTVRFKKDEFGQYVFPAWAQGASVSMAGLTSVENSLVTANTMLVGDFTLGTVYVWDSLIIEMGYIDDDFTKGLVTISAYLRENLRVKSHDEKGFVYITDIAQALSDITEVIN
jgi:HK97 family phage major capsid protein